MNEDAVFVKCAWRIIPFLVLLYVAFFLDRVNVGFAALTMNSDLGFSASVYGLGAGLLFIGISVCTIPSTVLLERVGARRWLFGTLMVWGVLSSATAFMTSPTEFYVLRFLLGMAEAGFVPGMVFYLTYWFPRSYRAQFTAGFLLAQPIAFVIGSPVSGLILQLDGALGLHGWQWLFLLEGLPSCVLGVVSFLLLPDEPRQTLWLTDAEKRTIAARFASEEGIEHSSLWAALLDARVIAFGLVNLGVFTCLSGLPLWLPQIVQAMGFSNLATSFIVALPFIAAIIAMLVWGRSSDARNERIWHVALPVLLAAAGCAGASMATSYELTLIALSVAVIGIYPSLSPLINLPSFFLRDQASAGGTALVYAIGGVGAFLGPTIIGTLKDATGDYAAGMAVIAVALLFAAGLVVATGRTLRAVPAQFKGAP